MDSDWSVPPVCQNAKDLRHPQVALDDAAAGAGRQQQSESTLDPIVKFSRYCGLSQDQLKMPTVTGVQPECVSACKFDPIGGQYSTPIDSRNGSSSIWGN
jgi:hypothetical protein